MDTSKFMLSSDNDNSKILFSLRGSTTTTAFLTIVDVTIPIPDLVLPKVSVSLDNNSWYTEDYSQYSTSYPTFSPLLGVTSYSRPNSMRLFIDNASYPQTVYYRILGIQP